MIEPGWPFKGIFLMMFRSPVRLMVLKFPNPVHVKYALRSGFMSRAVETNGKVLV